MKKISIIIPLACSIIIFANCHPKAYRKGTDKTKPEVTHATATYTDAQIGEGKIVYDQECGKCHDLPKPQDHTAGEWHKILPKMIVKANIADDKGRLVNAYVYANLNVK